MQKESIILNKLKELKDAAWNLPVKDSRSRRFAKKYAAKTSELISEGVRAVGEEAEETEQMARSFFKMLEAKLDLSGRTEPPTEEEVKAAIEQLKDVGRFSIFTTLVILPGGVVSLLGLELLARKFGIKGFKLIPSSFRKKYGNKNPPTSPMKFIALSLIVMFPSLAFGQMAGNREDWPQWRGPDRLGIWHQGPEVEFLRQDMIVQLWAEEIGPGYNGPTVAEGRVYAMDYVHGREQVHCFSAENGQKIWTHSYPVTYSVGYPTGPRASVLVRDGKAYSFGTMGKLVCFETERGEVLWEVNTLDAYQVRMPIWGLASNPIIVKDKLIVQIGGASGACLVAYHKDTGKEIWRALEDEASYSSPVLITQAGKEVLVVWTGESISGLSPVNGEIYWSVPFQPGNMIMNIADPVYDPPYLFMSGFFDGSYLLKLDQETTTAELVYHRHGLSEKKTEALHCCISTPVIRDGYIYGIGSYGEARCLDLLTGERIWEDLTLVPKARWANVHLIRQGDLTWGFNELGELLLGRFTPEGYVDKGRAKVIDPVKISPNPRNGVCWAHPAFAGKQIFIRSDEQLICIQLNNP